MGLFVRFLHFGPVVALTLLFAGDAMSSPAGVHTIALLTDACQSPLRTQRGAAKRGR